MKKIHLLLLFSALAILAKAQETYPVNGIRDVRPEAFAFVNATIVKDPQTTLQNATLVIRKGKIVSVGSGAAPKDAVVVDCKGRYIYPSFIDLFSDYGIPVATAPPAAGGRGNFQNISNTKGAFSWNQALKPETDASSLFSINSAKAKELRGIGFGTLLTHQQDGLARGTGTLIVLGEDKENLLMVKEKAAAFYSFDKGVSTQDYPTSLMGSIAVLRQSYLDGQWYKSRPAGEGVNLSLQAWNDNQALPQIFDANDKWNDLRALKIAKEFGAKYIVKGGGNEYQRINDIKASGAAYIIPLNFPLPIDIEDPGDARVVALSVMKHWEMAPLQPAIFEKAGIPFALTAAGLKNTDDFLGNLRKSIANGLSAAKALEALTKTPASMIGVYDKVGSIDAGKLANFIITTGPVFEEKTVFVENWVKGEKYIVNPAGWNDVRGTYKLTVRQNDLSKEYNVDIAGTAIKPAATIQPSGDSVKTPLSLSVDGRVAKLTWSLKADSSKLTSLTGIAGEKIWTGTGYAPGGVVQNWNLQLNTPYVEKPDTTKKEKAELITDSVQYPFSGYGWFKEPVREDFVIRNATVWTNEADGKLENADVLVKGGKIAAVGKNLSAGSAKVIDGTGKHLTAGIIDEHSHIAINGGVNECSESVTAEARVPDVVDPEDISIYRQLAGGVTSAHLLHGSCNTIGGQTQLIKLRWGQNAEDLKFANWDPFIKFALGENVKRSYSNSSNRFPDTRMGVEQVLDDAFQRAVDYQKLGPDKRKDLELEALSEILNKKRFITCHSYVQSEINMLMHVSDKFGFRVNTFTHILEGYKVADKMKAHGAAASTFSDWWAYKSEVQDAIAYNAAIMQKVGLTVAINSDDPEMARHLNQESAKTIKYGNTPEQEALKMCTLNPAIMLHVADRTGSIKVGKDADLVLWNGPPLSTYSRPEKTIVDGIVYFDLQQDLALQKRIASERMRLIQMMIKAKKGGAKTTPAVITFDQINECELDRHAKNNVWDVDTNNL